MDSIIPGTTDRSIIFAVDTIGLTITDMKLSYTRWSDGDGTSFAETTSVSLAALATISTAHTDNRAIYISTITDSSSQFLLRVDFPDLAFASGVNRLVCGLYDSVGEVVAQKEFKLIDADADLVDLIWDEVLTGATHNVQNSSGKRLRQVSATVFSDGTAQTGGGANSIKLESGAVSIDDEFNRAKIIITGGTGVGQEAIITSCVASTDTITTTPAWPIANPDDTTEYQIIPGQVHATVRNGGYDNSSVYIDTVGGASGVEKGVNGTSTNKSSVVSDAYTIAVNEKIKKFTIDPKSAITLPSNSSGFIFDGSNYTLAFNGQNIHDCDFMGAAGISGIATASGGINDPTFFLSGIGSVTLPPCNGFECGFFGTFTIGSEGNFTFGASAAVFGFSPVVDFGASRTASGFFLPNWTGGQITIKNYGVGAGTYEFELSGNGDLTIDATCTGGSIIVRGNIDVTDNSGGAVTVIKRANITQVTGTTDKLPIKKGVANPAFYFILLDSSGNAVTGLAGTPVVQLSKDNGSYATMAGTVTEIGFGTYAIALTSADNTFSNGMFMINGTGASTTFKEVITESV